MANLITLTGPSGCGKSTAIAYFLKQSSVSFRPSLLAKFTTRAKREDDGAEVRAGYEELPKNCDLVYEQYGVRYGIPMKHIFQALAEGFTPLVILNDVRTVEDVRSALGEVVRSIFIFRSSLSLFEYRQLAEERGAVDEEDLNRRFQKAQAIYRIYIENIHLFDHVIINAYTRADLRSQIAQVVRSLARTPNWPLRSV